MWEERTFSAASSAAFFSATAFLACQTTTSCRTAEPGGGHNRHPDLGGSEKVGNLPLAIMGALNAHQNLVRAMGPECRCAVRNAAAARVGGVRAGCGV